MKGLAQVLSSAKLIYQKHLKKYFLLVCKFKVIVLFKLLTSYEFENCPKYLLALHPISVVISRV